MKVLAYDLNPKKNLIENYNIKYTKLDELLMKSDYITLHIPLTKENYHKYLICAQGFKEKMLLKQFLKRVYWRPNG